MKMNLLAGGPVSLWPDAIANHQVDGEWIGIDRGNLRLLKLGITPLVAIGDFDSMNADEFKEVKAHVTDVRTSKPEKDDTDTELGLNIALNDYHADEINIYGGTGGRIDHFLVNLLMVLEDRYRPIANRIRIIDRQNTITFYLPGRYALAKEPDKKYLAFVPLTPMTLTLPDEKYQLDHHYVKAPVSYSSNEFVGTVNHFEFDDGILCVIQSKD